MNSETSEMPTFPGCLQGHNVTPRLMDSHQRSNITLWSPVAVGPRWVYKTPLQSKRWAPARTCPAAFSAASPSRSISAGSACWSTTGWNTLSNKQTEDTQKLWMNKSVMVNTLRRLLWWVRRWIWAVQDIQKNMNILGVPPHSKKSQEPYNSFTQLMIELHDLERRWLHWKQTLLGVFGRN